MTEIRKYYLKSKMFSLKQTTIHVYFFMEVFGTTALYHNPFCGEILRLRLNPQKNETRFRNMETCTIPSFFQVLCTSKGWQSLLVLYVVKYSADHVKSINVHLNYVKMKYHPNVI